MLKNELETAISLARRASDLILDFYEKGCEAEEKIGIDSFSEPVTIADRLSSELIIEGLEKAFPADGILSEEAPDSAERLSRKRVWMIDPIDGTSGFIDKNGDFAVQIGLTENGKATLGVVLLPATDILYFATAGTGAFCVVNNETPQRMEVSSKTDFNQMILAVSRSHRSPKMGRLVDYFGFRREIQRGSVGVKIGLITTQIGDAYIHLSPRTKFWDTCAPEIILAEAGGKLTDLYGEQIPYDIADVQNHNGVLATNGISHSKIVAKLRPLLTEFGRPRTKSR